MMRVKGIYQHKVVKLLEAVDVPEGTEVEVILPTEQEQEGQLTPEQKEILQRTKGMWAGDDRIEAAFKLLEEGWEAWQVEES